MRTPPLAQTREKVLIEITGVLRNLSVVKKYQRDFGGAVLDAMSALLFRFTMNGTLMLNVARILSKLSLHQFCRAALSAYAPNIEMLLQLLAIHDTNLALAVRVCFVLGNLTVSNDENRRRIGLDFSGALCVRCQNQNCRGRGEPSVGVPQHCEQFHRSAFFTHRTIN